MDDHKIIMKDRKYACLKHNVQKYQQYVDLYKSLGTLLSCTLFVKLIN